MNETRMLTDAEINAYQKGIERGRAMHRPDRGRNCGTCDFWQPTDHMKTLKLKRKRKSK